jgi:hypothetical protein
MMSLSFSKPLHELEDPMKRGPLVVHGIRRQEGEGEGDEARSATRPPREST